jgi:hypothetical protein
MHGQGLVVRNKETYQMEQKKYNPQPAMYFGGAVYVGVVAAATTLFISFVLTAFPPNAYFSRVVMTIGGVLIGASMLAFPVALHTWTVEKIHRLVATGLYYGEMLLIMINTIVSFMSLLAVYSDFVMPEWAKLYEPFAIGSIVYTLAAWGTVFLLDPAHKRTQKEREADEKLYDRIAEKRLEFVESIEGEDVIAKIVAADIETRYDPEKFKRERKHFGSPIPAPAVFVKKELQAADDATFRDGKEKKES